MLRKFVWLAWLGVCLGCSGPTRTIEGVPLGLLKTEKAGGNREVDLYDVNGDGRPEIFYVYEETATGDGSTGGSTRRLVRKDTDLNFDGRVDVRAHYDENAALVKEEKDTDFDGRVDHVDYYRQGQIEHQEIDFAFDGRADLWRFFEDGKLVRKERDTDHDGRVDEWEYFENGKLARIGRDVDRDGTPEIYEEAAEESP